MLWFCLEIESDQEKFFEDPQEYYHKYTDIILHQDESHAGSSISQLLLELVSGLDGFLSQAIQLNLDILRDCVTNRAQESAADQ